MMNSVKHTLGFGTTIFEFDDRAQCERAEAWHKENPGAEEADFEAEFPDAVQSPVPLGGTCVPFEKVQEAIALVVFHNHDTLRTQRMQTLPPPEN